MVSPLIECIPNFSDARRPEVIAAIQAAISSVPGAYVLDLHSDVEHNRSVITFAGQLPAVEEAAFQAIATAGRLIDLEQHTGQHPRIGAADVVPFVPLQGATMADCIALARRVGERVGRELGIPVYLYAEAAARPDRQRLENVRRGEYEGLKTAIATDPERLPDFGPARLSGAGASVIGARQPLVAFNVFLTSTDIHVAKKIAKAVRHSSGGLRGVKAIGMHVQGLAQVSMNLTEFPNTPLARVVELVRREAERYGAGIHHSELVGLIPQAALDAAATWYIQLDGFQPAQVLENRLAAVMENSAPAAPTDLADRLAQIEPVPAAGSAAAYTGAMAAALLVKALRVSARKTSSPEISAALDEALSLQRTLKDACEKDPAAYRQYLAAPSEQTRQEISRIPLEIAGQALAVLELMKASLVLVRPALQADVRAGGRLALAAVEAAALLLQANSARPDSPDGLAAVNMTAADLLAEAQSIAGQL